MVCTDGKMNVLYWLNRYQSPFLLFFLAPLDVNVRVSCLTLLGAVVSTQAPLSEVQLLLQQPAGSGGITGTLGGTSSGGATPQEQQQSWRRGPAKDSPPAPAEADTTPGAHCWLLQLCVSLVIQPREEPYSDSDASSTPSGTMEPSPVRLEALQVRVPYLGVRTAA